MRGLAVFLRAIKDGRASAVHRHGDPPAAGETAWSIPIPFEADSVSAARTPAPLRSFSVVPMS